MALLISKKTMKRRNRGLALTETVITLPLLLLLLMATAEYGNAFWQYNTLTKCVRDGVRYASRQAATGSTGVVVVDGALSGSVGNVVVYGNEAGVGAPRLPGLAPGNVTITAVGNSEFVVTANYSYQAIFGVVPVFFGGGSFSAPATLTAGARMRVI